MWYPGYAAFSGVHGEGIEKVSDIVTVPAWLRDLAARHGGAPAVSAETVTLSYAELDRTSADIARGLLARGIGKGTRVGMLFGNGADWVRWWVAISRIGALCIPLSTFQRPAELARVIRHADLHLLIAQSSFLNRDFTRLVIDAIPQISSAGPELALVEAPFLRAVVFDQAGPPWARDVDWIVDAGREPHWAQLLDAAEGEVHVDDEALCIYTSGQSAAPKGALFTHGAILTKARYFSRMFGFREGTVTDVTLPFFWVGGLVMALLPTMHVGGETRCTEHSTWGPNALKAGPASTLPAGMTRYPSLGMTETFGMYAWGTEPPSQPYPTAPPLDELQPGFEIRIVDDHGAEVADGVPGEILVRGPTNTTRLHKVPRSEAFDDAGFYRTGDLAVRHDQRIRFAGRMGDMIKTSGANVSPAEVERELAAMVGVAAAYVVGLPDEARGELVAAAVVHDGSAALTEADIEAFLRERLSPYKVPKVIVFLESRDEVPLTPSTKVSRRDLAEIVDRRRRSVGRLP